MDSYFILISLLIVWAVLHSFLLAIPVTDWVEHNLPSAKRFYRIFYNLLSFGLFLAILWLEQNLKENVLFAWDTPFLRVAQLGIFIISFFLFLIGGREYSIGEFLGFRQLIGGEIKKTLKKDGGLHTGGILRVIRHPWYLGALLIIWARPIYLSVLLVNLVLSAYVIIGTLLEERKLTKLFGEEYKAYQREVSMLVPWKWICRLWRK